MTYWNEIEVEVEQKIAQERYQIIRPGQHVTKIKQKRSGMFYHRTLNYLGDKLVTWGYYLKQREHTPVEIQACESR